MLHVLDPHERTFPYDGLTEFQALESTAKLLVNPSAIRSDYLERMNAFRREVPRHARERRRRLSRRADRPPLEETLLELLVSRARLQPGAARRTG